MSDSMELLDLNVDWHIGGQTSTSFKIKIKEGYVMIADRLIGEVRIEKVGQQK